MYIGNIELPAIEEIDVEASEKSIEALGALGTTAYDMAEYGSKLPVAELSGYLLQKYGSSRILTQLVEDAQVIRQRSGAYNFISANGRMGWFFCSKVEIPYSSGALRDIKLNGLWMDVAAYITRIQCRPVTRSNDWNITGQNWITLPVGVSGTGDTVSTEDGDVIRVQADVIEYDLFEVESGKGECRCYDGSIQIFNHEHIFSGDCVISNGLYKVVLASNAISIYYWNGSAYTKIDDFTAGTLNRVTLTKVTADIIECKTNNGIDITIERGRVPLIYSSVDLTCGSLTPADMSTSSDNYLTLGTDQYVCSDRHFSIASNVIGAGKIWIFYAADGVQTVAHNALVISNLKREVIGR